MLPLLLSFVSCLLPQVKHETERKEGHSHRGEARSKSRAVIAKYDANGDGHLSGDELLTLARGHKGLTRLHKQFPAVTGSLFGSVLSKAGLLRALDANGDGRVSVGELDELRRRRRRRRLRLKTEDAVAAHSVEVRNGYRKWAWRHS